VTGRSSVRRVKGRWKILLSPALLWVQQEGNNPITRVLIKGKEQDDNTNQK